MAVPLVTGEKNARCKGKKSCRPEAGSLFKVCFLMRLLPPPHIHRAPTSPPLLLVFRLRLLSTGTWRSPLTGTCVRASRHGYFANYRNITQGFPERRSSAGRECGGLGGTLSFPSLILITGGGGGGGSWRTQSVGSGGWESLLNQ